MKRFERIKNDSAIKTYIVKADESLGALGFTEHSFAHVNRVSMMAVNLLEKLGYDSATCELCAIASYLHDIGNIVNRSEHAQSGAIMAFSLLGRFQLDPEEIAVIVQAIGNHDESTANCVSPIAAALILSDKSDVRRSRVRNLDIDAFDIHDRVNYSVESSTLKLNELEKTVTLSLQIDTSITPILDYFEIFLERMQLCRKAAEYLGLRFSLRINHQQLL